MTWVPAYDVHGSGPRTLFLLHGIFGHRGGWRTFARALAAALPGWTIVAVDHRHHGDSRGAPPPDTVDACADDLAALAAHLGVRPLVTVGHSFGGKVVLRHAARHPDGLAHVCVLDAPPGAGPRGGEDNDMRRVVGALAALTLPRAYREDVTRELREAGLSSMLAVWMGTNLVRGEGGYRWRFDFDGCRRLLDDYFDVDAWPVLEAPRLAPTIDVIRADRSDRWLPADLARFAHIQAPTRLLVLPDAGHWLHADNPRGLLELVVGGIPAALR